MSFSIQLQTQTSNFIKKETLAQVFFCEFSQVFKNFFLQNNSGDCFWKWIFLKDPYIKNNVIVKALLSIFHNMLIKGLTNWHSESPSSWSRGYYFERLLFCSWSHSADTRLRNKAFYSNVNFVLALLVWCNDRICNFTYKMDEHLQLKEASTKKRCKVTQVRNL